MRTIGVVTTSRADYGIYLPLLKRIKSDPDLRLHLIVSGMHLSPEFGLTVQNIEADGFEIAERVEMLLSSDTPEGIAKSVGVGVIGFAQIYARYRPDILIVLGDRFEMLTAVLAALPYKMPVAHIHGGELTEGLIDDAIRHSITKLSHLHFVATDIYAKRVEQLGEEAWRVTKSGALSLDNLLTAQLLTREEIEIRCGLQLNESPLLVTFHPVTLEYEDVEKQTEELLAALRECALPIIFTLPNADTRGRVIMEMMKAHLRDVPSAQMVDNFGAQSYFSMMGLALAMVGNSSSGIIEAASFGLPVVNIGNRQQGRLHSRNVIDVPCERVVILQAIRQATSREFHHSLKGMQNPYGDGQAAEKIIAKIKEVPLDQKLIVKKFSDLPFELPD